MTDDLAGVEPVEPDRAAEPEPEPASEPEPVSEPVSEPALGEVGEADPPDQPAEVEISPEHEDTDDHTESGSDQSMAAADGAAGSMAATDAVAGDAGERASAPDRARRTGGAVRASVLIGVLFALLGFGLAVQVHTNSSTSGIASARQDDLVRILDDLSSREDRLRQQISSLQAARRELSTSGDKASVALSEARTRSTTLAILAGTAPARGPGVRITIDDPGRRLDAEDLLDAVEELRAAGAEAFQVGSVRIGMSSAFTQDGGVIRADGTPLDPPYVITAIGDPGTLATALNIPGGVVASVRNAGGKATVTQSDKLVISALRPLEVPQYASPAPQRGN